MPSTISSRAPEVGARCLLCRGSFSAGMIGKAIVFDHLRPLLNPGGVLFGATILAAGVDREAGLRTRFSQVDLRTIGCGALFTAHAD